MATISKTREFFFNKIMTSGLSFGMLSGFDHSVNEWSSYKSRLSQWFIANDYVKEEVAVKRKAIFLSSLSEGTFKLASNLALPRKLEDESVTYEDIVKLLDDHFTPKRFGFAEKSNFYSATQSLDESHTQWAARLRGLAAHCGFKQLEEALLDRFIMGMKPGNERDKLFAQDQRELTLARAIDLAESVHCARKAAMMTSTPGGLGAAVTSAASQADYGAVFNIKKKCSVCGFTNHTTIQCRYKNAKCRKCGTKGHLRRMCSSTKVKYLEEGAVDEADEDDGEYLYNIQCKEGQPMAENIAVGNTTLKFEIDSGSAVSVISENIYKLKFPDVPLSFTNKKLLSYTGAEIHTCGTVKLPVSYEIL